MTIAESIPFRRIALLVQNQQEALHVAGSVGMDEALLQAWTPGPGGIPQVVSKTGHLRSMLGYGTEDGTRSLGVVLGEHGRMIVIPFAATGDRRLLGAIAVCALRSATHEALIPPPKRSP